MTLVTGDNPNPRNQKDLLKFVTDPENIKKAAEGSIEKRLKVMDTHNAEEDLKALGGSNEKQTR